MVCRDGGHGRLPFTAVQVVYLDGWLDDGVAHASADSCTNAAAHTHAVPRRWLRAQCGLCSQRLVQGCHVHFMVPGSGRGMPVATVRELHRRFAFHNTSTHHSVSCDTGSNTFADACCTADPGPNLTTKRRTDGACPDSYTSHGE